VSDCKVLKKHLAVLLHTDRRHIVNIFGLPTYLLAYLPTYPMFRDVIANIQERVLQVTEARVKSSAFGRRYE